MHYFPVTMPVLLLFFFLFIFAIILIELKILTYAYEKMGISRRYIFFVLLASLWGTYFNIPLYHLGPEKLVSHGTVDFFGMPYVIPMVREWPGPLVSVNVGGAVIPTILSLYLLFKNRFYLHALAATCIVTLVVNRLAYPVVGVGIAEPIFVPPLIATAVALILSRKSAPALAYISGTLGTLIGADLMNLSNIPGLGAPVVSIGGAGTFDGIFLTGIVSVLLASIFSRTGNRNDPQTAE